jgi:hypothetical protein
MPAFGNTPASPAPSSQTHESAITLEVEARNEYLERNLGTRVRELRRVEIKTNRALRTILHSLQPEKSAHPGR